MFVVRDIELYTNYEACINGFTTSFENSINKANANNKASKDISLFNTT